MNLRARLSERVHIVGMYSFLKGRCSMVEPETRRIDRRCHDLPTLGKTENDPEPDMPATCRRSATSGFPRFLHGTHDIPRGTTGRAIALHETGLSTDTLHPGTTTGTTHNTGNHGARLTGSRYPFRTKKHPESHENKEKQIISIAFISPFN